MQLYHHLPIVHYSPLVSSCVPKHSPWVSDENALGKVCSKQVRDSSTPADSFSSHLASHLAGQQDGPLTRACLLAYCICSGCTNIHNLNGLANRPSEFSEMLLINVSISQSSCLDSSV